MIGANFFSARRWVATRDLKKLRFPAQTPITPDIAKGSYLVTYWILDGTYEETLRWSVDQVLALHAQKRMQPPRDNISTAFYQYVWGVFRDADGVPPELALEHPYPGIAAIMIDRANGVTDAAFSTWLRDECLPAFTKDSPITMSLCLRPLSLPDDAPAYVPRPAPEILDGRYLLLSFLEAQPQGWWSEKYRALDKAIAESGMARLVYAAPFIPTIPGTDKYVDEL